MKKDNKIIKYFKSGLEDCESTPENLGHVSLPYSVPSD